MPYEDRNNDDFSFDLNDQEVSGDVSSQFELIPPGWYLATVDRAKPGETTKGDKCIDLMFKVDEPAEFSGAAVWDTLVLAPASSNEFAANRRVAILRALGHDTSKRITLNKAALLGRSCCLKVKHNTYTDKHGEKRTNVKVEFDGMDTAASWPDLLKSQKADKPKNTKGANGGTVPAKNDSALPF